MNERHCSAAVRPRVAALLRSRDGIAVERHSPQRPFFAGGSSVNRGSAGASPSRGADSASRVGGVFAFVAPLILFAISGCVPQVPEQVFAPQPYISDDALVVPGNCAWVDTGIDVEAGRPLTITAKGQIQICKLGRVKDDSQTIVGPEGTFFYSDQLHGEPFPMPAAGQGPASCFCLIGRIGTDEPFYVGTGRSWVPKISGRLFLGINDYDVTENKGDFYAEVSQPPEVQPASFRTDVKLDARDGKPSVCGNVVVIYVDGLRPDVVEEMAAMGHLPNIKQHFIDHGVYMRNSFTAFPSDTITSNGTMWTGCFSDRHGLKGQMRFSRWRQKSDSFLEPMGPNRSSRQLTPQGVDRWLLDAQSSSISIMQGEEMGEKFKASKTSYTPAVYDHLRAQGEDWATGALPVMTQVPPPLWTRSMTKFLPYLHAQDAWNYMDDANTDFAIRHLLREPRPLTIIWLPETDSVSHKQCRGQFGSTRRTIARADLMIGQIVQALEIQGRLQSTYLMLVSDHGHLGGRDTHLARYDVTNELVFDARQISSCGQWVGGGLGLSVRQHRYLNHHTGDAKSHYVFVDGDSDGCARMFFPRGHYKSGDWSGPNRPSDLLCYQIAPHLPAVNLPLSLASAKKIDPEGKVLHPIDLVLCKAGEQSVLITTCDRGQAIIERRRSDTGVWVYRYTPVKNVTPTVEGELLWEAVPDPQVDPLGLVGRVRRDFFDKFHDETLWLWVTTPTDYPDSVVSLSRHMLWQENLNQQECEYASDIVVTARHGWLIGTANTPGTTHGYPLAESMRATWYLSGPGIRHGGRIDTPCRLADLTPTILELTGTPFEVEQLDGRPLRTIYNDEAPIEKQDELELISGARPSSQPADTAVYWNDTDLRAWQPLEYRPEKVYGHLPLSMNVPQNGWDLNNIAYNAMALGDWSVFRLTDDALSAVTPGRTRITQSIVSKVDSRGGQSKKVWVSNGVQAFDLPDLSLTDYSFTSSGNLLRADRAVDWLQERGQRIDYQVSRPFQKSRVLGGEPVNRTIDGLQAGAWELYRFTQRVVAEVLDETVLNGMENSVDAGLNATRSTPAEVRVGK